MHMQACLPAAGPQILIEIGAQPRVDLVALANEHGTELLVNEQVVKLGSEVDDEPRARDPIIDS